MLNDELLPLLFVSTMTFVSHSTAGFSGSGRNSKEPGHGVIGCKYSRFKDFSIEEAILRFEMED